MEGRGSLTLDTLDALFKDLSKNQFTGLLDVYDEKAWKEFYFASSGLRVTSIGTKKAMPLGELLVRKDLIDSKQADEAATEQREKGGMLGQILVELGILTEEVLDQGLRLQADLEFLDLFFWKRPTFEYRPGLQSVSSPIIERKRRECGTRSLSVQYAPFDMFNCVRQLHRDVTDLRSRLRRTSDVFCMSGKGREKIFDSGGFPRLGRVDQRVIILIDGKNTLADLFQKARVLWIDVLRVVDRLLGHGAIERKKP